MTTFAFRTLLGAHDPADPAEATLVLLAASALNGLSGSGREMDGAKGIAPSERRIAAELGLSRPAVRRGVALLEQRGDVTVKGGVTVKPEVLARRWALGNGQVVKLDAKARGCVAEARQLLVVAFVLGQRNPRTGELTLSGSIIAERLGIPLRGVRRAIDAAVARGALCRRRKTIDRHKRLLVLMPGKGPTTTKQQAELRLVAGNEPALPTSVETGNEPALPTSVETGNEPALPRAGSQSRSGTSGGHEPVRDWSRTGTSGGHEPALKGRSTGGTDSPDARARTRERPPAAAGESRALDRDSIEAELASFVTEMTGRGVETMKADRDGARVALLIERVGPTLAIDVDHPTERRQREAGHRRERLELARGVIRWCPSPERLARWCQRVVRRFEVENLAAYLRSAAQRGDPGTVLESHTRNTTGRAAEHWADFTPDVERAIEGPRLPDVQKLTAGGAAASNTELSKLQRDFLRRKLRRLLDSDQRAEAREALVELVGEEPTDDRLIHAVAGICSLAQAKEVLAA